MIINWNKSELEFLTKVLEAVDTKAIDPQFRNLVPRMVMGDNGVNLEESEIHVLIEALNDYTDGNYIRSATEEDKEIAAEHISNFEKMGFVV